MPSALVLVAQLMCWHVSATGEWWHDENCPEKPGDQGAAIYIDDHTFVNVQGDYYLDDGWATCLDGQPPDITNQKTSDIWQTTVDCRSNGNGKQLRGLHTDLGAGCPVEPKYEFNHRAGAWQLHIFCPDAAPST